MELLGQLLLKDVERQEDGPAPQDGVCLTPRQWVQPLFRGEARSGVYPRVGEGVPDLTQTGAALPGRIIPPPGWSLG